eukprot:7324332-Heterocapsa_arctica.AAC.1
MHGRGGDVGALSGEAPLHEVPLLEMRFRGGKSVDLVDLRGSLLVGPPGLGDGVALRVADHIDPVAEGGELFVNLVEALFHMLLVPLFTGLDGPTASAGAAAVAGLAVVVG